MRERDRALLEDKETLAVVSKGAGNHQKMN